jgi:DNA-binding MarR family transcriptional regulator
VCTTYIAPPPSVTSIDDHLHRLRQTQGRPEYRRRLLDGVPGVNAVGTLRLLRSIERAEAAGRSPSIRDLAVDLEIEHSTASRSANDTTRRGLTQRNPCAEDQRRVLLRLTDAGRAAADRATQNRRDMVAAALAGWPEDDVRRLDDLLGRLVAGMAREAMTSEDALAG